jgi:hypothetical protein
MKCPSCGHNLRIGKTYMTFVNDDTPRTPTEAYTNLPMICINSRCRLFGGDRETGETDLSNPKHIVQTVTNRMNG